MTILRFGNHYLLFWQAWASWPIKIIWMHLYHENKAIYLCSTNRKLLSEMEEISLWNKVLGLTMSSDDNSLCPEYINTCAAIRSRYLFCACDTILIHNFARASVLFLVRKKDWVIIMIVHSKEKKSNHQYDSWRSLKHPKKIWSSIRQVGDVKLVNPKHKRLASMCNAWTSQPLTFLVWWLKFVR